MLYRIDDRLIHGQVVLGWGKPLAVEYIVLVDDVVRASAWEQDLYRMAVPQEVEVRFADVTEARAQLEQWRADPRRGILVTGDVATMVRLQADEPIPRVNLGGIHQRPGRRERLPYLFLAEDELDALRAMQAAGTVVTAQDVPTAPPVPLGHLA